MKHHLIVHLDDKEGIEKMPFWGDIIEEKVPASETFLPEIESLFKKYNTPVWYASEYLPRSINWSADEVRAGLNRVFRVILKEDRDFPEQLIREISLIPYVIDVRRGGIGVADIPEQVAAAMAIPGHDPESQIFLKQVRHYTQGDESVKIAVLDTGVDRNHPEIAHALAPGMDFVDILDGADKFIGDYLGFDSDPDDEVGHGTHVCGILAAKGLKMARGVVPSCRIIPVRVLGALRKGDMVVGAGLIDNINNGIKWAVDQGADIINMSLGIKHEGGGLPHDEVIKYALSKGVTIVAASGNDGLLDLYYPGALPNVIAVGAVDQNDQVASFSTYGAQVSFVAPGTAIISAFPDDSYCMSSGTSQASPFVAGGIALLKSYSLKFGRKLKDNQVKYILKHTADRLTSQFKDIKSGYGRINLLDAIKLLNYKLNIQSN